jgi:hypothetical protein
MTSIARESGHLDPRRPGPGGGKLRCYQDGGWLDDWTVGCPEGRPQRPVTLLGYRLKAIDCLQVRVVLGRGDSGVCQMFIEQSHDCIYVSALACLRRDARQPVRPDTDVGCRVWLDEPLGARTVIDIDRGIELPWLHVREGSFEPWLYVPRPAGELWPYDGLETLGLDALQRLATQLPRGVTLRL